MLKFLSRRQNRLFGKFSFEAVKKEFGHKLATCPHFAKTITLVIYIAHCQLNMTLLNLICPNILWRWLIWWFLTHQDLWNNAAVWGGGGGAFWTPGNGRKRPLHERKYHWGRPTSYNLLYPSHNHLICSCSHSSWLRWYTIWVKFEVFDQKFK